MEERAKEGGGSRKWGTMPRPPLPPSLYVSIPHRIGIEWEWGHGDLTLIVILSYWSIKYMDFRNVCRVMRKQLRFPTPIRTCYIPRTIFGSTRLIETVVIGWILFCFRSDTFYFFLVPTCNYRTEYAKSTASSSALSAMPVFDVKNRRRFSTPCVFGLRHAQCRGRVGPVVNIYVIFTEMWRTKNLALLSCVLTILTQESSYPKMLHNCFISLMAV